MISTQIINLDKYRNWDELIDKSQTATFFQTREWLALWMKHFLSKGQSTSGRVSESLIFGVFDDGQLIGIAPFIKAGSKISFLGVDPVLGGELVSDFGDIIAVSGREKEVWEVLIKNYPIIQLSNYPIKLDLNFIREDSPSLKILKDFKGTIVEEVDVAPYLDLPQSWEEYLNSLERHDRHELKRKIRKLESEGAFKICYEGDPNDINEFFRLMTISNEQKRDFLSKNMKAFFLDIFDTFWPRKIIRLCFMKLDGNNIAAALIFFHKNQLLLYNSGIDPSYSYLAPGLALKAYLIKYAIEQKLSRFDFLRGNERYKYDLGGKKRKLYNIRLEV